MAMDSELTAQQAAERRLYAKYGKPLEANHAGEFVAISWDGEILLGKRDGEILRRAIDEFGRGNFVMACVGSETIHEWVTVWTEAP